METPTKRASFRILSLKESVFITLEINVLFFLICTSNVSLNAYIKFNDFNIYIQYLFNTYGNTYIVPDNIGQSFISWRIAETKNLSCTI